MRHLEEYNRIIEFRKSNPLPDGQYGEKHHIKPKSIYPELVNDKDNIVRLSAQEHFLAHYHLWHAYRDELHEKNWARKMCYAFNRMKQQLLKCDDVEAMSKLYEEVRIEFSKVHSESLKGHRPWSRGKIGPNKGRTFDKEVRKHMSEAHKGKSPPNKGKSMSVEQKTLLSEINKGSHWFNNGIEEKYAKSCPDGFVNGRLKRV